MGFVVTMVLLQLGFLEAVRGTATSLYDQLDFEVVLISPRYEQLYDAGTFLPSCLATGRGPGDGRGRPAAPRRFRDWRCPPSPLVPERDGQGAPGARQTPVPLQRGESALAQQGSCWRSESTCKAIRFATQFAAGLRPPGEPFSSSSTAGCCSTNSQHPDFGWVGLGLYGVRWLGTRPRR